MKKYTELNLPFDNADNYFDLENKQKLDTFFFKDENFNKLLKPETYYIIGEKGSGKTTYAAYFCNSERKINNNSIVSHRYELKSGTYSAFIKAKENKIFEYTSYEIYWKACLLEKLLSTISKGELTFQGKIFGIHNKIMTLLDTYNFTDEIADQYDPVQHTYIETKSKKSEYDVNVGLKKCMNFSETEEDGMVQSNTTTKTRNIFTNERQKFINQALLEMKDYSLNKYHYLFVDGVDVRPSEIPIDSYKECVKALTNAVYDLNRAIRNQNSKFKIILLTRLDMFMSTDMNNTSCVLTDNSIYLNWGHFNLNEYNESDIYTLVNGMLSHQNDIVSDGKYWEKYFNFSISGYGRESTYSSFEYLLRLTCARPRDFVRVLRLIQESCKRNKKDNPNNNHFGDRFHTSFSTYFVSQLKSELSFHYNKESINELVDFIKSFRCISFSYQQFELKCKNFSSIDTLLNNFRFTHINELLSLMYNFNIICFQESKTVFRWKYRETTIDNFDECLNTSRVNNLSKFQFHRALEKAWSLYL